MFRDQMAQAFGSVALVRWKKVRRNMEIFERTFAMFVPFTRREGMAAPEPTRRRRKAAAVGGLDEMKRRLEDMQKRIDQLTEGEKKP